MWFMKRKRVDVAPDGMPRVPAFSGLPMRPVERVQEPVVPQYTREFSQPEPHPALEHEQPLRQLPRIEMPLVQQQQMIEPLPDIQTEIPKREPLFVQKRTYPQREARALGPAQRLEQVGEPDAFSAEQRFAPLREPERTLLKEQGFTPIRPAPVLPPRPPPEARLVGREEERGEAEDKRRDVNEGRPVFVKLEEYRDVITNIEVLKQKIKETEYLLDRIEELRTQEQVELDNCHGNLNKLKEKLISIDKKLFEV